MNLSRETRKTIFIRFENTELMNPEVNSRVCTGKANTTTVYMHPCVSISSCNMNIWSCGELIADRIRADLAENLSGLRIAEDRYERYIASRFVGILIVQNWVAGIFVRTAAAINCEPKAEADSNCADRSRVKCRREKIIYLLSLTRRASSARKCKSSNEIEYNSLDFS